MWLVLFVLGTGSFLLAGAIWWLFWITYKKEWEDVAREEGFKEGYEEALVEHGLQVDDKDHSVTVKTIHPLDEVTEIEAIAVPEHNPIPPVDIELDNEAFDSTVINTEEMPPDPGIVIPLQDDEAGH